MRHGQIDVYHWRVRKAIAESPYTCEELAQIMGCDRKVLSSTRCSMMSSYHLAKFCAATGVSADYILGISDEQKIA
ncbi:hypothetical protein SAMN02910456_01391 [Ruminococcaceae bacterium YRB3002]|nr:hypothetical protein SAMN02910456_01391 [Ruminococcaceae bacterium YRB3002]